LLGDFFRAVGFLRGGFFAVDFFFLLALAFDFELFLVAFFLADIRAVYQKSGDKSRESEIPITI